MIFYFFIIYIYYSLLCGLFLCFKYLAAERKNAQWDELLLLLLIAPFGYGNWQYKREMRLGKNAIFPKKWFVWKKMISINVGFLVFYILIIIWMESQSTSHLNSDSISVWISYFFKIFGYIVQLMILYLVFISLPKYMVKSIQEKQEISIEKIAEIPDLKENKNTGKQLKTLSSNRGIDSLTRIIIQLFGGLTLGVIAVVLVYEEPSRNPGDIFGPLVMLVITVVFFLIGFIAGFMGVWLLFKMFNKKKNLS